MRTRETFPHDVEVIEHVRIPTRDGTVLSARVWRPTDAFTSPKPAVLEYIPYRHRDVTRGRDARIHPYLAGHGYVSVRVDLRGSGDSEGVLLDEYCPVEHEDAIDVIDWLADQPWCDGNVGMFGISWGGFNSLQVAAHRPPALKAIVSACATDDLYLDNMHYMDGALLSDNLSEATVMFAFNSLPPDPDVVGERWREMWHQRLEACEPWVETWLRHPRRDAYWRSASVREDHGRIACPVLAVGGWADGYTNAIFRLLEHLDVPCKGLIGPWGHRWPHDGQPGPAIGFLQEMLRWWDRWLKGERTGVEDDPDLRVWEQDTVPPHTAYEQRPGRWVAFDRWPSEEVRQRAFPLAPDRLVFGDEDETTEAELAVSSPLSVGAFGGKWASYSAPPDLPYDQREEDGGALVFETPPLPEDVVVVGRPSVDLRVRVDRPDAMVAVRLCDVLPEGPVTRVTFGLLDLRHRHGSDDVTPIVPGHREDVRVHMNGIAQRFPAGHRIRLSVSTSYWPLAWPSPHDVTLKITTPGSVLHLPVHTAPSRTDEVTWAPAEGAPPEPVTVEDEGEHGWRVVRDLVSYGAALEIVNDQGAFTLDETGTRIRRANWEWYRSIDDEPTSAQGETVTERELSRGDWSTRVRTRTRLRCSATAFLLDADLDAYERDADGEDVRVFTRSWHRTIPRDVDANDG